MVMQTREENAAEMARDEASLSLHRVVVTQICRVERRVIVEVKADSIEEAVELQDDSDAPAYDDPAWTEYVDLHNEVVGIPTAADLVDLKIAII